MVVCRLCGIEKDVSLFYKAPKLKAGHDSKCKECAKKLVKNARERNPEHYKEFDRLRAMRPDRVEARKKYRATHQGKAAVSRAHKKYSEQHPHRRYAQIAVSNAIRDGRLIPWPVCFVPTCECSKVEAHHPDYGRPLDVVWLCNKHHRQAHSEAKF